MAALAEGGALTPAAIFQRMTRAAPRLRELFRTPDPVVVLPVPAGVLLEIALLATIENRALVLVGGPEGEALADTAEALGKEVIRLHVRPGQSVEPAHLARFLSSPSVDTVALVHSDAGTGVLAPLAELSRVVRERPDVLLFADCGASLGAAPVETAAWGLDVVLARSEGPLGLPRGLALAALSPRFLARARSIAGRGRTLDLALHQLASAEGRPSVPLPGPLVAALDRQLERLLSEEGLVRRWARHERMREMVEEWVVGLPGLGVLASRNRRAPALTCLTLPENVAASTILSRLERRGFRAGPGLGADRDRHLRIAHMGDLEPAHLAELLAALGRALSVSQ